MPTNKIERPATGAEIERIQRWLQDAPSTWRRWRQGAENALVMWAICMLALVMAWLGIAWLAGKLFNFHVGLASQSTTWVVGIGIPVCAVYAAVSSVRWLRGWHDDRPLLRADLDAGQVVEEHYTFIQAKRFQEQEHGGLIYFLLTSAGRVFTLFDHESQKLGVHDQDPLKSSFLPHANLAMVRAPRAGYVISRCFSGAVLDAGVPLDLVADPEHWPESEAYCDIPWPELEARLGMRAAA